MLSWPTRTSLSTAALADGENVSDGKLENVISTSRGSSYSTVITV
jgi:hypothetical protein